MNKNLKLSFLSVMTMATICSILAADGFAQCVKCTIAGQGWICTAGMVGGDACITEGINCTLVNPCNGRGLVENGEKDKLCAPKILEEPQIRISDEIVREVGRSNPRLALVLISVRNISVEFHQGSVSAAPIEVTQTDVENYLTLPRTDEYFKTVRRKAGEAFANKQEPIVYNFSVVKDTFTRKTSLEIRRENNSETLTVDLSETSKISGESQTTILEATSWRVK
jgi:hypothetical protein